MSDFKKGDRVIMTQRALENGLEGRRNWRRGIVTGYSHCGRFLRVLRNGTKQACTYDPVFWKKI